MAGALPLPPALLPDLRRLHASPNRHHHTWDRVAAMLAEAEEVAHGIADRPAFILAVLFHTAVFDRARPGAVAEGIALMRRLVPGPAPRLDRAEALVLAWARQEIPSTDDPSLRGDAALLLDMDLAPLGEPPGRHAAHEAALRAESAHLTDDQWADGRAAALRLLAWRDRIYRTDRHFLARERRARRNIEAALARLEGG